jgi:two-component system phosphate regulon sensor histidine kinase PhoR
MENAMGTYINNFMKSYDDSNIMGYGEQRLKSQIVNKISREFRSPLTSIIGFAEILEEKGEMDEQQRAEYASYIRQEGLRLTKLIDDLIELDALELNQSDIQLNEAEIQKTIVYAVSLVEDLAYDNFITISLDVPDNPVNIKFDREIIVQVLYQLLHNAVRFNKPGGEVLVKLETATNHIVISIHDTGPGIPSQDIPYLFNRFSRLYNNEEQSHTAGVGLTLVKHLVNRHKGDITVQSRAGEGSTFILRLPVVP